MKQFVFCILFIGLSSIVYSQTSNWKSRTILIEEDTIQLDSLSIIASSFSISQKNVSISNSHYILDEVKAQIIFTQNYIGQVVQVEYRTYPYLFSKRFGNQALIQQYQQIDQEGFIINSAQTDYYTSKTTDLINFGNLDYNGNLSRGVGFGNAQSLNINSNFNLQLSGMITDDIEVTAAITDNNIPIQPEGNTAQIQEFDKVFIQLRKDKHFLTVGDFTITNPNSYFLKFNRNLQGIAYKGEQAIENVGEISGMASVAVSRGKFVINNITAQEGNQGPYRLEGPNGETFIIVLSGSERVFINDEQLQRGDNNDYVIDYNLGEIRFTPNIMITQDMRIRVEFEYVDRYYFRSLYHVNAGLERNKWSVNFNVFSQQDAKNQSINQNLDSETIQVLENIGDQTTNAFASGVRTSEFEENRILYVKKDTSYNGIIDTIYEYTTQSSGELYTAVFSFIGEGQGSYDPITSTANGRVFEYKGINQGSYLPVVKLIPPQKQQLFTTSMQYAINEESHFGAEMAISNQDLNSFSAIDNDDNTSGAFRLFYKQSIQVPKDSLKTINIQANYEFKHQDFVPVERYRAVEFTRNFNTLTDSLSNEHLSQLGIQLNDKWGFVAYNFQGFQRTNLYSGFENQWQHQIRKKGFSTNSTIRFLSAKQDSISTQFIRPYIEVKQQLAFLNNWSVGGILNHEIQRNSNNTNDSLLNNSFLWQEYSVYLQNSEEDKNQFRIDYKLRYQHLSNGTEFDAPYLKAHNLALKGSVLSLKNQTINWNLTYRNLQQDTLFSADKELNHFYLGRIEYGATVAKGFFRTNTLYELGAGREQKLQYTYIEDPNGQGSYAWEDINDNGVQEINEFYVSTFENENRFLRIVNTSLEFQPVNTTRFNQSIYINPKAKWFNEKGIKKILAKFSVNTSLQFSSKIFASGENNFGNILSPFAFNQEDSLLVNNLTNIRNIIFFNRSDTKFGVDYTYNFSNNKTLLTGGFERRKYIINTFNVRWNIINNITWNANYSTGFKQNESDFFLDRKFEYIINEAGTNVSWLFKKTLRVEGFYQYSFKSNPLKNTGGQFSVSNEIGVQMKYAKAGNYSIQSQFSLNLVGFEDGNNPNQQLQFDMLQGFQEGNNYLWNIGIDKTFAKLLQLTLQYDGRKTGSSKIVHTGRMLVRAIF